MFEPESFRKYRKIDLVVIVVLALLWALVTWVVNIPDTQFTFFLSLTITTMFMTFTALLIRKFFAATFFYLAGSAITINVSNLGGLGVHKVAVLFVAGIVFELFFLLLNLEIKNVPIDIIASAAISNFSIPLTIALFVSRNGLMNLVWNFALMSAIVGAIGSVVAFMLWYNIKNMKPVIRFEYEVD